VTADSLIQLQQYHHLLLPERQLHVAKHPTKKAVSIETVIKEYGATFFREALARFVTRMCYPHLSDGQIEHKAGGIFLSTHTVPVYHTLKWVNMQTKETLDAAHAKPLRMDRKQRPVPAQFDTVLIKTVQTSDVVSIKEHQIGQIRVIFSLSEKTKNMLFPSSISLEKHLAYVEWFTPFSSQPHQNHRMYSVSRILQDGVRLASIIPVSHISGSVHLFPQFGSMAPREWTSSNVLDVCSKFFVNPFSDRYNFVQLMSH
jgi:hypothetical protein